MKKLVVISLIGLLMMAGAVQAQFGREVASVRIDQIIYDPFPARAGEYVDVKVKIENQGNREAKNLVCELVPKFPFSIDSNEDPIRDIGKLTAFEDILLEYQVRVDANAVEGNNELDIRCGVDGLDGPTVIEELIIDVESERAEFALGLVKSTPDELRADMDDVKLEVEVQNIGEGDAKLVTAELQLLPGISPSDSFSNAYSLGTIPQDSSKTAVFFVDIDEDIKAGLHQAILVLRYKDDNNNQNEFRKDQLNVRLNVQASPQFSIEEVRAGDQTSRESFTGYIVKGTEVISDSTISQGSSGELRVKVQNNGEEEAESVSVKIFKDSTHPFEFDEIFDFIGDLDPRESGDAVFTYTIDGDAALKKYLVNLEIRYVDGNDVRTTKETIPFEVKAEGQDPTLLYVGVLIVIIIAGLVAWRRR